MVALLIIGGLSAIAIACILGVALGKAAAAGDAAMAAIERDRLEEDHSL